MLTTTITARARNLRFAYSTTPTGNGIEIAVPDMPASTMTLKAVEEAIESAARNVSGGTYYNARLWVGDKPVARYQNDGARTLSSIRYILNCARNGGADVTVAA